MTRVALVTGAAGGIGRATVAAFARAGWHVVGTDRTAPPGPEAAGRWLAADLGNPEAPAHLVESVSTVEGRLDALIHVAAVQVCKGIEETTLEEWDEVFAVNLRAAFLLSRAALPLFRRSGGGAVVHVASVHAVATSACMAPYAASKGGLVALTRALAVELASERVRVNAVLPGAVDTAMLEAGLVRWASEGRSVEEVKGDLGRRTVWGRVGRPEEVAEAILFLADDRSSFTTGQFLTVDGGATARLSTE